MREPDVSPQGEASCPSCSLWRPAGAGLNQDRRKGVRGLSRGKSGSGHITQVRWARRPACHGCPEPALSSVGGAGRQPQPGLHPHAAPAGRREWLRFQEAEYKFFEHHSTWAQAQRICTWFQAELVSVHSQAELDFLGHNLQKVGMPASREGSPGAREKALPTLTCLPGFPSSLGARSSTGGPACTPQRATGASGGSPGRAVGRWGACVDG